MMQRPIQIEHVIIESKKSFDEVKAALESSVPQLDAGIFLLLQNGESNRARTRLENGPELAIFFSRDHGGCCRSPARRERRYNMTSAIRSPHRR